ncbi:hypothetical protein GDO86_014041 [Hymenochirus boettgeri]|uniref:Alpha/beta hydrolase fold-3 domain-containing protein n=1 Tax=Hymenochirus boettgeri TaxID=247094 RepID=A0A8T2JSH8_9PIPI|nr:hypothetical protein GDO86_014041 [Hymenochirus boettgeri]
MTLLWMTVPQYDGFHFVFYSKEESGFMVAPLVARGIAVMVMDYDVAPKGHMDLIVSQVRRSIAMTLVQYPHISGVYFCGHSAGAHLVAMSLCTDWSEYQVSPDIKGAMLVSGLYDLLPITHIYVNDALKMSQLDAERNSPMQYVTQIKTYAGTCQIAVVVAQHDPPEFHRQSLEYFQGLKAQGLNVTFTQVDDTDHFDVIERLSEEQYVLTQIYIKGIVHCNSELFL